MQTAPKQDPGTIVFYDAYGVNKVTVGALPDMLTFTPNGRYLLVDNEESPAEYCPDGAGNPEGSVSVIDLRFGASKVKQSDVRTADFKQFNQENIDPSIRILGLGATIAQDLAPEYIAVSADSQTAWVAWQENNAFAALDVPNATITDLLPLGTKDHSKPISLVRQFTFDNLPLLGTTAAGQNISLGGFSGLHFESINPKNGNLQFITHPDRGPNTDSTDIDDDGTKERPFPILT